jgi:serine phosphatase RsbU (regulator of sigma subunit)
MSFAVPVPQLLDVSAEHRRALSELLECVRRGQCCALLGPRLSGTTDLLQCMQTELADDPTCTCVYIDLKASEPSTLKAFFASLARMTAHQVVEGLDRGLSDPVTEIESGAQFRLLSKQYARELGRNLIIIVDNLHSVPKDLIQALLTSLRAAYMDQDLDSPMVVPIVCGAFSLAALTVGQSSPFANVARTVYISGLSDRESQDLIENSVAAVPFRVSAGACRELLRATRGDPRLIERVCRLCVGMAAGTRSQQITASTVRRAVREFIQEQAPSYEPFVEAVSMVEEDPDLLRSILMLLQQEVVPRRDLPLPLSPDLDALALTGMVRDVDGHSYQVRNGIYRQFLASHFSPSRVGYLMTLAGRWDLAIEYQEAGLSRGTTDAQAELLAATVSAMYAAQDVRQAASYLVRGLAAVFQPQEASIWHAAPNEGYLKLIGSLGSRSGANVTVHDEIPITEDSLEARAYRGARSLRGKEVHGSIERAVPLLLSGSEAVGVATLVDQARGTASETQRERDLQLVGYLSQAARAIDEVHTRRGQLLRIARLEQERTAQELRMARQIQVSFLPGECPSLPGWEISADWRAAREVGGDFYDFVLLDADHMGLVIADVSDKGMPAALFMSLCRTLVRVSASETRSPAEVLRRVNEWLMAESRSEMFLTAFYGVLSWPTGELTFACAGHNPPVLWRCPSKDQGRLGAEVVPLAAKGIVLGILEDVALEERRVAVLPGDILILYTDGVTEPINAQQEEFGRERLIEVIADNSDRTCAQIVQAIGAAVSEFVGDQDPFDDYTLVGIKRTTRASQAAS